MPGSGCFLYEGHLCLYWPISFVWLGLGPPPPPPQQTVTPRLPDCPGNRLTDEVVRNNFAPRKIPATYFCLRPSQPHGHSAAGWIRSTEKSSEQIGNQTRYIYTLFILLTSILRKGTVHFSRFTTYRVRHFGSGTSAVFHCSFIHWVCGGCQVQ
jgi:hypothetical protein